MDSHQADISVEYGIDRTFVIFNSSEILEESQIKQLQEALRPVIEQNGVNKAILNFGNVKFMSSAFLGLLVRIRKWVAEAGGSLELCNIAPNIYKVFEITRLNNIFDIT
ncbi:MAG: STAS domain-containing protein [Planctomycetota bacterium]|jgi:anti-sigma B factor antagonist